MLVPTAEGDHAVGIVRAHLEEDAAKTVHVGGRTGRIRGADYSLVDFNRGGTPLVEIVTAPDIHSSDEAKRFLQLLRQTIVELGISDAEMEKGTLRVDANVSVRPVGSGELRTRTELKNMNSFTFVARGIDAEIARQIEVWESGGEVRQETYDFDAGTGALTRIARRRRRTTTATSRARPGSGRPSQSSSSSAFAQSSPSLRRSAFVVSTRSRPRARDGTGDGWARSALGRRRLRPARRGSRPRTDRKRLVGAGVDPASVPAEELARLVDARERIPRAAFDEAISKLGHAGFSADDSSHRRPSPTSPSSSRSSRGSSTRIQGRSRPTGTARKACWASSSARS